MRAITGNAVNYSFKMMNESQREKLKKVMAPLENEMNIQIILDEYKEVSHYA